MLQSSQDSQSDSEEIDGFCNHSAHCLEHTAVIQLLIHDQVHKYEPTSLSPSWLSKACIQHILFVSNFIANMQ